MSGKTSLVCQVSVAIPALDTATRQHPKPCPATASRRPNAALAPWRVHQGLQGLVWGGGAVVSGQGAGWPGEAPLHCLGMDSAPVPGELQEC